MVKKIRTNSLVCVDFTCNKHKITVQLCEISVLCPGGDFNFSACVPASFGGWRQLIFLQTTKVLRVSRGIALLFLGPRHTRWGWGISPTPWPPLPPKKYPVPILQEAGWAPGPFWTGGKSLLHRDSIPARPAPSSVVITIELPGPPSLGEIFVNMEFEMLETREGWKRRASRYYDILCSRSTRLWELSKL